MSALEPATSDLVTDRPKQKNCSRCGVKFGCGPTSTGQGCWCAALPHVSLVASADQDCLCPSCLGQAIAKLTEPKVVYKPINVNPLPALIEGEDYDSEGAAIVFTARYHLKRGYCCDSGCRHCPYDRQPR